MKDAEIMRVLAEQRRIEEQEISYGSPVFQDKVYIIMYQSSKSGGTYTELRKSERGKNRLLANLHFLGVDLHDVHVFEQVKTWVPEPKTKEKKTKDEGTKTNVHSRGRQHTSFNSGRSKTGRYSAFNGLH
jgi:hypothetical protein